MSQPPARERKKKLTQAIHPAHEAGQPIVQNGPAEAPDVVAAGTDAAVTAGAASAVAPAAEESTANAANVPGSPPAAPEIPATAPLPPAEGKDTGDGAEAAEKGAGGAPAPLAKEPAASPGDVVKPDAVVEIIPAAPAAPRLPDLAAMFPKPSTIDPVMHSAFSRVFETTLMSLRSTYDKMITKQTELDRAIDQARAMGYPEEDIQAFAAQYRWTIPAPS